MKRFLRLAGVTLVFAVLVGVAYYFLWPGPIPEFNGAEKLTLFSLYPRSFPEEPEFAAKPNLDGYPILGRIDITDAKTVAAVKSAVNRGMKGLAIGKFNCFNPRHAIRVEAGGRTLDLVICFECRQIVALGTSSAERYTDDTAQSLLNNLLDAKGIDRSKL